MWRPRLEDLLEVAAAVLDEDVQDVRAVTDHGLAESALGAPFAGFADVERYPTLAEKVAVLIERVARAHAIRTDGNKRTAFVLGVIFAERNGLRWSTEDGGRDAEVVEGLVTRTVSHDQAVRWVRDRTS